MLLLFYIRYKNVLNHLKPSPVMFYSEHKLSTGFDPTANIKYHISCQSSELQRLSVFFSTFFQSFAFFKETATHMFVQHRRRLWIMCFCHLMFTRFSYSHLTCFTNFIISYFIILATRRVDRCLINIAHTPVYR